MRRIEVEPDAAGQRLDNYLFRHCKGVPKSHVYRAIRSGQVRINRGRCKADTRLQAGDSIRIPPMHGLADGARIPAPPASFPVLFEDRHLLVINKPAGVAVHGGSGVSFGVIEQLRAARPLDRLELAHRLDRGTSGVLIVARTRQALLGVHAALRHRTAEKYYLALVQGDWVNDRQHIRLPLLRYLTPSGERRVRVDDQGKPSHSIVHLLERLGGDYSLLEVLLRTGRTHQIRVHLASQGFSVAGDEKYSSDESQAVLHGWGFRRMFLHASRVVLKHPVSGESLHLEAPLPDDCLALLQRLGSAAARQG